MEIQFQTTKLERHLTHASMLRRKYGALAPKIYQRIAELRAMRSLDVARSMPALGCHELVGLRSGQLAIRVSPNYRMLIRPCQQPPPVKEDRGLDWSLIDCIRVLELVDYH